MSKVIIIALFIAVIPFLAVADSYSSKHQQVVKRFQGNDEPTAKDAIWTQSKIFKIGVIDNGSDRSGYAQYACLILNDYGFAGQGVWVQIIDIVKLNRSGKWVKLGAARCK